MIGAPEAAPPLSPWRAERVCLDRDGLLVVDKPIGMPVHGGDESLEHSVVERVGAWLRTQGRSDYLGVHSRLDQGTSGLLLFVTDEARNADVARATEQHALERIYHAVVLVERGRRLRDGRVELSLEHRQGKTQIVSRGGQRAVTHVRVLERRGERALVELKLETGRTHQIRATLAHLGAPLLGDTEYGGPPAARIFLHATRLSGAPLPEPLESPAPRSFERALAGDDGPALDDLRDNLLDAFTLRAPLLASTAAFRALNGDGDGTAGLSIDAFGPYVAVNVYDEGWLTRLAELAELLQSLGYVGGYLKKRVKSDLRAEDAAELAPDEPFFGQAAPEAWLVREGAAQFEIRLTDGLSSGLFVDQRANRQRLTQLVEALARQRRDAAQEPPKLLNLFCYTSSFSVQAALVGARTVSVDLSGRAIERSRRNFEANGLALGEHQFWKDDAMKVLARAERRGDRYDFIVLDPPSFATVGKGTFSVKGRYVEAVKACLGLLSPGGRLLAVTNHTATSPEAFRAMLGGAARERGMRFASLKDWSSSLDTPPGPFGPWPSKSLLATLA
ncbi:MAG TPA: pseudouridine synthase [Polyangiaceae bacterium]|nr:pseudouridine synthase [Polyangiaceae bacterium]